MNKLALSLFAIILCGVVISAQTANKTPETTIKNFYSWYVREISKNKFPLAEQPTSVQSRFN